MVPISEILFTYPEQLDGFSTRSEGQTETMTVARTYIRATKTDDHLKTMLKRAKPLITLGGIAGAVGLILAYNGFLEPAVTPGQLPGPTVGGVAILAPVALAALFASYIDGVETGGSCRRADGWRRSGVRERATGRE